MARGGFGALVLMLSSTALADEGMWTFDNFPSDTVKERYGFEPSQKWLDEVRLSSARLANGCSSSFVSRQGLVMTNHHCVITCVQQLSTSERNFVKDGFYAAEAEQELQCPAMELNQLTEIKDVTATVNAATEGKEGEAFVEARKARVAELEAECGEGERCDVVSLYNGGLYHLYRYRRVQDVRLVFAPSVDIAFFGGDPDNFNFPRYVLDVAFLRAYDEGKPLKTKNAFRWTKNGTSDGELVFVSGHPGRTSRLETVAQLAYARDYYLPELLVEGSRERGVLDQFSRASEENARIARTRLFRWENAIKAFTGRRLALVDDVFFGDLVQAEQSFREKLGPEHPAQSAWEEIADAMETKRQMRVDVRYKEYHRGFGSSLLNYAVSLVRWSEEQSKPNTERLEEYTEAKLPALKARMGSQAPVYPEMERLLLEHNFLELRAELGPDDPFVGAVLGKRSPSEAADLLIEGTELADPAKRMELFEGDPSAISGSEDPMLVLAKILSDAGREVRSRYEREVVSVVDRATERIARARFEVYGTQVYPDATFSLRLSFGAVKGFEHRGRRIPPFTEVGGLYERATGRDPFALPAQWKEAKDDLDLETPMNFVSTNDIIGGNSGSPIFDRDRRIVGVIFDGNIYSLGGDYGFDARVNRAVSVDARFIKMALDRVYGAKRILRELR